MRYAIVEHEMPVNMDVDQSISIEEYIGRLPFDIVKLSITNETIPVFPMALLRRFTSLSELELLYCEIEDLPNDLSDLTCLLSIDVSYNRLKRIPDLSRLRRLKNFVCNFNFLETIPNFQPYIGCVRLENNCIDDISPLNNKYSRLYSISLKNNCIRYLPYLPDFEIMTLTLSGNPVECCSPLYASFVFPVFTPLSHYYLVLTDTKIHRLFRETNWQYAFRNKEILLERVPSYMMETDRLIICHPHGKAFFGCWLELNDQLRRFRKMFYLGKCRRRLRQWLFTRVLAPFAARKYHPDRLIRYMANHPDVEDPEEISERAWLKYENKKQISCMPM